MPGITEFKNWKFARLCEGTALTCASNQAHVAPASLALRIWLCHGCSTARLRLCVRSSRRLPVSYELCPNCGSKKHVSVACPSCGYTQRLETTDKSRKMISSKCSSLTEPTSSLPTRAVTPTKRDQPESTVCKQEKPNGKRPKKFQPIEQAALEMDLLLKEWPSFNAEQRKSQLRKFAKRGKWHRKVLRILLERTRNQQMRPRGFHEGARTPGSNLRKIDGNIRRK